VQTPDERMADALRRAAIAFERSMASVRLHTVCLTNNDWSGAEAERQSALAHLEAHLDLIGEAYRVRAGAKL
jgi:hypothetical protein